MIYTAPEPYYNSNNKKSIFLAGSIEEGKAVDWQKEVIRSFKSYSSLNILNPRRKNWDNSINRSFNDPAFYQQVNWELSNLEKSTYVVFYFDPQTISPITLFELGMCVNRERVYVICDSNYFRFGNIQVICDRYKIPLFSTVNVFLDFMKTEMGLGL